MEVYPRKFKHFKSENDLKEAIQYSKGWIPERRWLVANKVDFNQFPEEVKF